MTKKEKNKKFGEYLKARAQREEDRFFGEGNVTKVSNKYFFCKRVLDEDNIIINTANTYYLKNKNALILIVGTCEAVYLQDWQLQAVATENGYKSYLVKLNRKYFKTYTFQKQIDEDITIEKTYTFDDFVELAKAQEQAQGFSGVNFKKERRLATGGLMVKNFEYKSDLF